MSESQQKGTILSILNNLWRNWAIAFGSLMIPIVLAPFMPRMVMPILCLALAYLLKIIARTGVMNNSLGCMIIIRTSMRTLFWSAILILAVNLLRARWALGWWFDEHGIVSNMPFLPGMIIFPVSVVSCIFTLLIRTRSRFCRECRRRLGFYSGDSVAGMLYLRESRHKLLVMMFISLAMWGVDWWYWNNYYIDVNLNSPDMFFFVIMPVCLYVVSLVFIKARYYQTSMMLRTVDNDTVGISGQTVTVLRFMVLSGDKLLLHKNEQDKFDVPVTLRLPNADAVDLKRAETLLKDFTGLEEVDLKYIYTNARFSDSTRIEHFALFVNTQEPEGSTLPASLRGEWYTLDEVDRLLKSGRLAQMLMNEIYRIFTVTMAWKTYDYNGKRLYPIKNYRPTFRLRDLKNWNVNYDDTHWLQVSTNNEDCRFYRLRKIWRKIFGDYEG